MDAASPADMADPKTLKYPVVLSDALLGKPSKETYTGVRYNHKPSILSQNTSATARLSPSTNDNTFKLTIDDDSGKYAYSGVRTTKDGNYVLIFDPERQVFVLHRLDSLFHMNVNRTPDTSDVDSLRRQFPQLEVQAPSSTATDSKDVSKSSTKAAAAKAKPSKPAKASSALRKPTTKKSAAARKPAASLPNAESSKLMPPPPAPTATAAPSKSSRKTARSPESEEEEEEEDDDDDGGLIVEYPGGPPRGGSAGKTPFGSTFTQPPVAITRRFSDFVKNGEEDDLQPTRQQQQQQPPQEQRRQEGEEEEEPEPELNFTFEDGDEDDDEEMEDVGGFKLPSPVGQQEQPAAGYSAQPGEDDADGEDDDDLADLEADLEAEFEKATGYQSESDVSEED